METTTRTRYGRVVKKPERYEPQEVVEDDFSDSDLESDWDEDISSSVSYETEELEDEETDDDDSFVASDDDEKNEESDNKDDGSDDDTSDSDSDDDAESVGSSDTPTTV